MIIALPIASILERLCRPCFNRYAFGTAGYFNHLILRTGHFRHRKIDRLPRKDPTAEADSSRLVQCICAIIMRRPHGHDDMEAIRTIYEIGDR
jgi:hypothetical protein